MYLYRKIITFLDMQYIVKKELRKFPGKTDSVSEDEAV
jgi:hypothetical protein